MKKHIIIGISALISLNTNAQFGGIKVPKINKEQKKEEDKKSESTTSSNANQTPQNGPKNNTAPINNFHASNVGKVIFSGINNRYSKLSETSIINEYEVLSPKKGNYLEAWFLFDKELLPVILKNNSINELNTNKLNFRTKFFLDNKLVGVELNGWKSSHNEFNKLNESAYCSEFVKVVTEASFSAAVGDRRVGSLWNMFFGQAIEQLTIGTHQLKIEITPEYDGKPYPELTANGNLTLKVNKKLIDPNDPYICFPAKSKSVALTKEQLNKVFLDIDKQKPLSAYLIDEDWTIEHNDLTGAIIRKWITACFVYKGETGKCEYVKKKIASDYAGGGKYTTKLYYSGMDGYGNAPCDCLK